MLMPMLVTIQSQHTLWALPGITKPLSQVKVKINIDLYSASSWEPHL